MYFSYKWSNDKNTALAHEKDRAIFEQLPHDVQRKIYSDFIFRDFYNKHKKFFTIQRDKKWKHSYFNLQDT